MASYLIAHDLGTSGDKATLFSEDGRLIRSCTETYPTNIFHSVWAEQSPLDWWQAFCRATRRLLEGIAPEDVAAVAFSGQMMGCVLVDHAGEPLGSSIIWCDQRAQRQTQQLSERIPPWQFYQITGHPLSCSYSLEKLMWVRDCQPERYRSACKMLLPKDYLVFRLTGQLYTDYSDASGTNCFDLKRLCWSQEILDAAEISPALMPQAMPSTHVAGGILPDAAAQCGLIAGTRVVLGGGDGVCASVGAGSVADDAAYNYLGSSSWISYTADEPLMDEQMRTFNWAHIVPGKYAPTGTMQAAGNSYQYLSGLLYEQQADDALHPLIDREISASPLGAGKLLYLPYLLGERSPRWNPDARGAFVGLTMEHTRGDIMRACAEGVGMNLALILDIFRQHASITKLTLLGGLAGSPQICRILCDLYGVPVQRLTLLHEATSMGAAVTAGVGVGLLQDFRQVDRFLSWEPAIQPDPVNGGCYKHLKEVFDEAYTALERIYSRLASLDMPKRTDSAEK